MFLCVVNFVFEKLVFKNNRKNDSEVKFGATVKPSDRTCGA